MPTSFGGIFLYRLAIAQMTTMNASAINRIIPAIKVEPPISATSGSAFMLVSPVQDGAGPTK